MDNSNNIKNILIHPFADKDGDNYKLKHLPVGYDQFIKTFVNQKGDVDE